MKMNSPLTVFDYHLTDPADIIRPFIQIRESERVLLHTGVQTNNVPHIGTYLTHAATFLLASRVKELFGLDAAINIQILDHTPLSNENSMSDNTVLYQQTTFHELGILGVRQLIDRDYFPFLERLSQETGVAYALTLYSEQQRSFSFRSCFLKTLPSAKTIGLLINPITGKLPIRIPCPTCEHMTGMYGEYCEPVKLDARGRHATFRCSCCRHGDYQVQIHCEEPSLVFLDLKTLYRNMIKEMTLSLPSDSKTLHVIVKGGDWSYYCDPINWALASLGFSAMNTPVRLFTPQIVDMSGAKLSKSRSSHERSYAQWVMNPARYMQEAPSFVHNVILLVRQFIKAPCHFYRSYTVQEVTKMLGQK